MTDNLLYKNFNLDEKLISKLELEYIDLQDFFSSNPKEAFIGHTHSYYQIIWFKEGEGIHYVDFKEYPIKNNTLFFISSGQIHYFDRNTNLKGIMILFNESFLNDENSSENIFLKYNIFNNFNTSPYYVISKSDLNKLENITNEIKSELLNIGAFAYHDYLKYLIKMFLINIQRNAHKNIEESLNINSSANQIYIKFKQSLEHNYKEFHTVKEYANLMNISTKTLTNCVIDSNRLTPLKLINERISLEAKRLLLYSTMKIKEISYFLGFEDPSYFVKFFKKQTGTTPIKFRKHNEYNI